MKGKATLKDRWGMFIEFIDDHLHYIILTIFMLVLLLTVISTVSRSYYDSSAVVTAIGREGVTVEYRDRRGMLKSDFMETSSQYSIGDEIIVHVDEYKYRIQNRVLLSDKD